MDLDQQQSQLKLLIAKGKEQGYLTYHEVNDHLPDGIVDPEQIEDIISMINDMGIAVHETAPDEEALLLNETTAAVDDDEDAAEEAAAALATLDIFAEDQVIEANRILARTLAEAAAPLAEHPQVAEVRQTGMILAIELVADRQTRQPFPAADRRGQA